MKNCTPALLLAVLLAAPAQAQRPELTGSWTARVRADRIELNLSTQSERGGFSNNGRSLPLAALPALAREPEGAVQFELRRAAGTLRFEGRGYGPRASGSFEFVPNESYARELRELGMGSADARDLFTLAFDDVTIAEVRQLQTRVTDDIDIDDLVRMIHHGAGPEYVESMVAAGFTGHTSSELVRARDHGVTARYATEMRAHGHTLHLDDLVRTRDHGVTPEYLAEMKEHGFTGSHDAMIRARDHGVTPRNIRRFRELGFTDLSLDQFVRLQDHGVSADFAADVRAAGYPEVTASQLVKLRDHGVSVSYIKRAQDRLKEKPTLDEIVRLRSRGVDW